MPMNYYIEIKLVPNAEVSLGFIWQKVFQQLHFKLVEHGYESERTLRHGGTKRLRNSNVAVSFPEYKNHKYPLGSKLRLFSKDKNELQSLDVGDSLSRLLDYVSIGSVRSLSDEESFVPFRQKRIKGVKRIDSFLIKKAKHISEKYNTDFDSCLIKLKKNYTFKKTELPFIQLESQTCKNRGERGLFKIFIDRVDVGSDNLTFDCYGLVLK